MKQVLHLIICEIEPEKSRFDILVAMESGIEAEETLGALGKTASKYMKCPGYVAAGIAALQTIDDIRNGKTGMAVIHGLDALMGVVGTVGPFGAGVSIAWGFSRAIWGN